jgi:hypothetical protein
MVNLNIGICLNICKISPSIIAKRSLSAIGDFYRLQLKRVFSYISGILHLAIRRLRLYFSGIEYSYLKLEKPPLVVGRRS